ncbi:MAG: pseudoazurin [Pseudomonadota bacterium]
MAMKITSTSVAALFAVSLAACGGSESSSDSAAPAEEAATIVESTTAAVEETASDTAESVTEVAAAAVEDSADAVTEVAEATAEEAGEVAEQVRGGAQEAADAVEEVVEEAAAGGGQTYEVQMLNADPDDRSKRMVFIPRVLEVKPGDTVTWVPTNPTHLSAATRGMIPEGVEGWQGRVNQPISYTFEKPGIYGYNCTPHQAAGMVGLVVVDGDGKLDNLEAAKGVRHPGLASRIWDEIWAEAEAEGMLEG